MPEAPGQIRLAMVGASFRRVGFERLAGLVLAPDDRGALADLREATGADEVVYIGTCNRVEVYAALPVDAARPGDADPRALASRVAAFFRARGAADDLADTDLDARAGADAIEHLFRVAASLDSLAIGECEILGQVRRAAERAREAGACGERLQALFREAQRTAALVREETAIGRTPVSIASLASRAIRDHFEGAPLERAVLVGVGDMTRKVAQALEGKAELLFVNRTLARAEELAERLGGRAQSLEHFREAPPGWVDVLVSATSAPQPIVGARELGPALAARRGRPGARPLLVCDLGLPPDVDPALGAGNPLLRRIALADLDPIARENQQRLAGEAERAHALVEREAVRYARRLSLKAEAEASLDALLAERLAHLGADDRRTLRRFAGRLAERLSSIS